MTHHIFKITNWSFRKETSAQLTVWVAVEQENFLDLAREHADNLGENLLYVLPAARAAVDDKSEAGALQERK